jgi:hypothetical protein
MEVVEMLQWLTDEVREVLATIRRRIRELKP